MAAGPVFNLLLAMLIFTVVNMIGLPVLTAEIGALQPDSAAHERRHAKPETRVIAVDGERR